VLIAAPGDSSTGDAAARAESPAALRARAFAISAAQRWEQPPHCSTSRLPSSFRRYCQWLAQSCPLSHSGQSCPRPHFGHRSHARRLPSASGSIGRAVIGFPLVSELEPGTPTAHGSLPSHLTDSDGPSIRWRERNVFNAAVHLHRPPASAPMYLLAGKALIRSLAWRVRGQKKSEEARRLAERS